MFSFNRSSRLLAALVLCGCGSPPDMLSDAGPIDTDAGDGFDPSVTYPGEGDECEFSLFCRDNQICVDGACARHERFGGGRSGAR